MTWIWYAFCAALALAAADICIKLAAGKLSNSLGLLFYGSCTFLTGLGWVILDRVRMVPQYAQTEGVLAAIGVGVSFSVVTICLYMTFIGGAPISIASPFIRLVGLMVASVFGLILLHEPLTWRYALGMLLALSGVYLIITR